MRNQKFTRRASVAVLALAATAASVSLASPAQAATANASTTAATHIGATAPKTTWTAVNSPGMWRNSPNLSDNSSSLISNGDGINLTCYYFGAAAGSFGNTLWYLAADSRTGTSGWINDHYLNTPGTAASPQPQASHCVTSSTLGPTFSATGSPGFWSASPSTADNTATGISNGDPVQLGCFLFGAPTGPFSNTLWYVGRDTRTGTSGWINDHNLTTPGTGASPSPQTFHC